MLKTLLHTVREAIFWMVLGAVLDGISSLLLFFVILNGSFASSLTPLILLTICSLTSLTITFVATQKGYFAGGLVMRYLAMALIRHLPLSLKPIPNANHLIAGPASQIMSVPAHLLHPMISGLVTPFTLIVGAFIYNSRCYFAVYYWNSIIHFAFLCQQNCLLRTSSSSIRTTGH